MNKIINRKIFVEDVFVEKKNKRPVNYTYWRNMDICVERFPDNYFELIIEENFENCPKNTRSCGVIDTQNNHLCLEDDIECPVNDVKFINKTSQENSEENSNKIWRSIKFDDADFYLKYSKNSYKINKENYNEKDKVLLEFKISRGPPCKNPSFENIPGPINLLNFFKSKNFCLRHVENKEDLEVLYEDQKKLNAEGFIIFKEPPKNLLIFDEDYRKIDSYEIKKLYKQNKIKEPRMNNTKFTAAPYEKGVDEIDLYSRPFFGLKINCLKKIKKENLKSQILEELESLENFLDFKRVFKFSFIIVIIFLVVLTAFTIYLPFKREADNNFEIRQNLSLVCYLPIGFILLICGTVSYINLGEKLALKSIFSDKECVDDFTLEIYGNFAKKSGLIGINSMYLQVFIIIALIIEIFLSLMICIRINYYDKKERNNNNARN